MKLPVRCRISDEAVRDDIRWLQIEKADGGFYLFQYADLEKPPKWDSFCNSLEDILRDCERIWGIKDSSWIEI
jgi:hypothetical protein